MMKVCINYSGELLHCLEICTHLKEGTGYQSLSDFFCGFEFDLLLIHWEWE